MDPRFREDDEDTFDEWLTKLARTFRRTVYEGGNDEADGSSRPAIQRSNNTGIWQLRSNCVVVLPTIRLRMRE